MTGGRVDRFFVSQRLTLHYAEWGAADAPVLLLVHGGRDHCRSWDFVAPAFADRWRVIAPDLRGHGDSAWQTGGVYDLAGYQLDIAELIDGLGVAQVAIVAHSLGGNIAIRYAGLHPDRVSRLVAIEGLGLSPTEVARADAQDMTERMQRWVCTQRQAAHRTPRTYASLDEATARFVAHNPRLTPELARHLARHGTRPGPEGGVQFKFDPAMTYAFPVDLTTDQKHALWRAVACPTLLMHGAESWASNPAEDGRAGYFRNARVISFAGAGHWPHHDRRDEFIAAVEDFIG